MKVKDIIEDISALEKRVAMMTALVYELADDRDSLEIAVKAHQVVIEKVVGKINSLIKVEKRQNVINKGILETLEMLGK